jgi:hypothetical protein
MNEQLQTLEHARQTVIDFAIQFGPKLVVALLILAAGYYVGRWLGRLADSMLAQRRLDKTLCQLPLIAGPGADIALAMQGVLGILAAGLTAIHTLLAAHPKTPQEPGPVIRVLTLAYSSVQTAIHPWSPVADFCITSGDISRAALKTFRERGITVSFPQREVRLLDAA